MMSTAVPPPDEDPRARAARTKRDRTRRALLDAADSAFGSRGWARTRVEDIAQSAGVSAATAYNHFPTKHALLAQVYAPITGLLLAQARSDIAAGRPVVEALDDQVRALCRVCARNRTLTAAFFAAVSEYTIKSGGLADPSDEADPRTLVPMPEALQLLIEHGQRDRRAAALPFGEGRQRTTDQHRADTERQPPGRDPGDHGRAVTHRDVRGTPARAPAWRPTAFPARQLSRSAADGRVNRHKTFAKR